MPDRRRPSRIRVPYNQPTYGPNPQFRRELHERYPGPRLLPKARHWAFSLALFNLKRSKPGIDTEGLNTFLAKPIALESLLEPKDLAHTTVVKLLRTQLHVRGEKESVTDRRVEAFIREYRTGYDYLRRRDPHHHA